MRACVGEPQESQKCEPALGGCDMVRCAFNNGENEHGPAGQPTRHDGPGAGRSAAQGSSSFREHDRWQQQPSSSSRMMMMMLNGCGSV